MRDLSIDDFKTTMKIEFEIIDLGLMKYFLGIEVNQSENSIIFCLSKFFKDILRSFRMVNIIQL